MLILARAERSARESPYRLPNHVYTCLRSIHEAAELWRSTNGVLGKDGWRGALQRVGTRYRPAISSTSRGKWARDYTFLYKGRRLLFEEHVTLGAGDPNNCLSIHWLRDRVDLVIVIGHCGRHLPNCST